MVKTLDELMEKVLRNPEKYGQDRFFNSDGKPCCPLVVEIIPDLCNRNFNDNNYVLISAYRLNCGIKDILDFMEWWDSTPKYNFKNEGE